MIRTPDRGISEDLREGGARGEGSRPHVEETIPAPLVGVSEAARAWFSSNQGVDFKLTGIVDPEAVGPPDPGTGRREIQLILCGRQDGEDVCLRERFAVAPRGEGFDVVRLEEAATSLASPAPLLDPPAGVRSAWLDQVMGKHAFVVLLFYRGFW